jgi:hypothetical protein
MDSGVGLGVGGFFFVVFKGAMEEYHTFFRSSEHLSLVGESLKLLLMLSYIKAVSLGTCLHVVACYVVVEYKYVRTSLSRRV